MRFTFSGTLLGRPVSGAVADGALDADPFVVERVNGFIEHRVPVTWVHMSGPARLRGWMAPATIEHVLDEGSARFEGLPVMGPELPDLEGAVAEAFGLRAFDEGDVRRDRFGRFDDELGVSVGRRAAAPAPRRPPETRIAKGYAQAAETLAQGFVEKAERDTAQTFRDLPPEFLTTKAKGQGGIEEEVGEGFIQVARYGWDTGDTKFGVSTRILNYPDSQGNLYDHDDPDLRSKLEADARGMVEKFREQSLETQRKQIRGGVLSPTSPEGKVVYPALERAQAENAAAERYAALRARFPDVPERLVVVSEKGYGYSLGIADVMVSASRNLNSGTTAVNSLAVEVHEKMRTMDPKAWDEGIGSRQQQLKPGVDHITVRSTAALLRHEWGHGLYDALRPEQRREFQAMLPDWDGVAEGLSRYAAGTPESRASYERNTSMMDYGYSTETFAEAVALVGGDDYDPEQWPGWVNRVADWIEDLEP